MLPLFAVLLFVLLPLMSLVIHVGLITLTRRQMQTAVNTAALEGLRFRDDVPAAWKNKDQMPEELLESCGEPPDPEMDPEEYKQWLNCARRWSASRQVANLYASDGSLQLGMGPNVDYEGGIELPGTDFRASALITNAGPFIPDPLELNLDNEVHGDMVAGQFVESDLEHDENSNYVRTDFDPEGVNDAFLVRMRRTGEDFSAEPGIASAGPPVPFLFGRGPFGGPEWLNNRERGTIVRATAIASGQTVKTVGIARIEYWIPGMASIEIQANFWTLINDWDTDSTTPENTDWDNDPNTPTRTEGESIIVHILRNESEDGVIVLPDSSEQIGHVILPTRALSVGQTTLDIESPSSAINHDPKLAFVPIVTEVNQLEDLGPLKVIVGFGFIEIESLDDMNTPERFVVRLTRYAQRIATRNALTTWLYPPESNLDWGDFAIKVADAELYPLLAPALVRSVR